MREAIGPKLAPSHKGGGWVWGTHTSRRDPVSTDHGGSGHG